MKPEITLGGSFQCQQIIFLIIAAYKDPGTVAGGKD